jgi:hypothetical protein
LGILASRITSVLEIVAHFLYLGKEGVLMVFIEVQESVEDGISMITDDYAYSLLKLLEF